MKLETRAEVSIPKPVEAVFDHAFANGTFTRILQAKGPIPGVVSITLHDGATANATGIKRSVAMSDKSTIVEEVTAHVRPTEHSYRWLNKPAPPFSFLVAGAHTTWKLEPAAGGTTIVWTYWFELTTPLVVLPMLAVCFFFQRWMQSALNTLRSELGGA